MGKFLHSPDQPKLCLDDIKHLNRCIISHVIEVLIKSLPTDEFTGNFNNPLKKNQH
jgi:hypothetical protein